MKSEWGMGMFSKMIFLIFSQIHCLHFKTQSSESIENESLHHSCHLAASLDPKNRLFLRIASCLHNASHELSILKELLLQKILMIKKQHEVCSCH